jgi:hypothetical protein
MVREMFYDSQIAFRSAQEWIMLVIGRATSNVDFTASKRDFSLGYCNFKTITRRNTIDICLPPKATFTCSTNVHTYNPSYIRFTMPGWESVGGIAAMLGVGYATFAVVSFNEVKNVR